MKKLMLTAAAAAMATGAFAVPEVYDYSASVTHMYVKLVNVTAQVAVNYQGTTLNRGVVQVYQKFKQTATLKGYLIVDTDGVTSPAITAKTNIGRVRNTSTAPVYDQGRNRAFLVVMNSNAEAAVRRPKILPAVLESKWFDTRFSHTETGAPTYSAGTAEGTLFVGGQFIAAAYDQGAAYAAQRTIRPKLDTDGTALDAATPITPEMFSDYLWTSCYLFGEYNGPQWSGRFAASENALDAIQPAFFQVAARGTNFGVSNPVYHDSWLNHAGIGTSEVTAPGSANVCCGLTVAGVMGQVRLNSLSGDMKGGIYICSDNGLVQAANVYHPFLGRLWEDQFLAPSTTAVTTWADTLVESRDLGVTWTPVQRDVWVDGDVEQNTTDVAFGTWSIKRIAWANADLRALTEAEKANLLRRTWANNAWAADGVAGNGANGTTTSTRVNYNVFMETIKGAAVKLYPNLNAANDMQFITNLEIPQALFNGLNVTGDRYTIPFLTPDFASAYGLAAYGK